jgi:hypothetical protein
MSASWKNPFLSTLEETLVTEATWLKSLVGDMIAGYGQQGWFTCALAFGLVHHTSLFESLAGPTSPAEHKVPA